MKVIELLNKIANGEEVPKKIKFCLRNFEFSKYKQDYFCRDNDEQGIYGMSICKWLFLPLLNDEVEIIEENKIKPLTKKDIEALGYACGEIQKCFTNGWTKSLENKPLEEHKIPEKLNDILRFDDLIPPVDENMYKIWKQTIKNHNKINEIIDYLEEL